MQPLLTLEQVAELVSLPLSTVRKYCREKVIPSIKIGKHYRVDKTDLEQFIEVKKKEESSAPLSMPIKSSNTDMVSRKEVLINDKYS